ncbi:glycosyltransferase [Candidatus Roizmanbacteria bacterium]|nr:glycosyltransferase [Candidatus Roizmanbacteria bacterium]
MKKKLLSVTIGIPAYNEENNIGALLRSILKQSNASYELTNIIVASDGSSDKTVDEIKVIKRPKIKIIYGKNRRGTAFRQNQIIKQTTSDVLVLLNADILIRDNLFLEQLIKPIHKKVDMVSCLMEPLPAKTFIGNLLNLSVKIKNDAFKIYKEGSNIYTCRGNARAFSRKLYTNIHFPRSVGEDAYSFLYCLYHGFQYYYTTDTKAYFRSPENLDDHKRQSIRFYNSQKLFLKEFGKPFVKSAYSYPPRILLLPFLHYFIRYPLHLIMYVIILTFMKVKSIFSSETKETWDIAISSKSLKFRNG